MNIRRRLIRLAVIALAIALIAWRYGLNLSRPGGVPIKPAAGQPGASLFSGTIQAEEVTVSSEYAGRATEVTVQEGDAVGQGQLLVRLDATLASDQVAVAEAQLAVAQATLARLKAGARPGAIAVAKAQEAQVVAAAAAARQALADAQALRDTPQDLALQAAVARQQLAAAEAQVQQAIALRDLANMGVEGLQELERIRAEWQYPVPRPGVPTALQEAPYDYWKAWAGLNAAAAARDGLRDRLAQLEAQIASPQALNAQVDAAAAAVPQAEAAAAAARAQVAAVSAGPTAEQVAAAEARVTQAAAALDSLRLQRERREIAAPITGTVLARQIEPGEVALAGAPLLTLGDLQQVSLILYVSEMDLDQVHLDQEVRVSVDSYPGRVFAGRVVHIADQAEFTPRNVATQAERINTFYAVKVHLPNADGALKPGMPADATFEEGQR